MSFFLVSATVPSRTTITAWLSSTDKPVDNSSGTANTRFYRDGSILAVLRTGAALHAIVQVSDNCLFLFNLKNSMRAHNQTHPASGALFRVQLQGNNIGKIDESAHSAKNLVIIHPASPTETMAI